MREFYDQIKDGNVPAIINLATTNAVVGQFVMLPDGQLFILVSMNESDEESKAHFVRWPLGRTCIARPDVQRTCGLKAASRSELD